MSRVANWENELRNYVVSVRNRPFEWGQHDCLLFAAGCINAVTGRNVGSQYVGTYSTAREAKALLRTLSEEGDVSGIMNKVAKRLPSVLSARRGDIVALDFGRGNCIGVVGPGGCYFVAPAGLIKVPLRMCFAAWRVF